MKLLEIFKGEGERRKEPDITIIPADPSSPAERARARYLEGLEPDDRFAYIANWAESAQNAIARGVQFRLESEGRAIEERERGNTVRGEILAHAVADLPQKIQIPESKISAIAVTLERQLGQFIEAAGRARESYLEAYSYIVANPPRTETHIVKTEPGRRGRAGKTSDTNISEPIVPNLHIGRARTPPMQGIYSEVGVITGSPDGRGGAHYNPNGSVSDFYFTGQGGGVVAQATVNIGPGEKPDCSITFPKK